MMKELKQILSVAAMLCVVAVGVIAQDKKNEKPPPPKEKTPVVVVVVKPARPDNAQKGGDKKEKP